MNAQVCKVWGNKRNCESWGLLPFSETRTMAMFMLANDFVNLTSLKRAVDDDRSAHQQKPEVLVQIQSLPATH